MIHSIAGDEVAVNFYTVHQGDSLIGCSSLVLNYGFGARMLMEADEDYRWMRTLRYPYVSRE